MISGRFGDIGELFFEVDLIAADGEIFQVDALLDTGFTTGWLAMNIQDID
jgi:predicted aspartyl protease